MLPAEQGLRLSALNLSNFAISHLPNLETFVKDNHRTTAACSRLSPRNLNQLRSNTTTMNALRLTRSALGARSPMMAGPSAIRPTTATVLQRRGYADAVADKIKLSLVLPHKVSSQDPIPPFLTEALRNSSFFFLFC